MNEVWNLSVIYNGFEDPAFETDLTKLKEQAGAYTAFTADLAGKDPLDHQPYRRSTRTCRLLF